MADFLLELRCEEVPARMQAAAAEQLRVRFGDGLKGKLPPFGTRAYATPRRLALLATGLGATGNAVSEERRGPRTDAPAQAIEGFLRSTGLTRDQLEERDTPKGRFLYAVIDTPGRPTADLLAELIPQLVRAFDWPKSMRWGEASRSTASLRWVRPLSGIVALLDDAVIPFEIDGLASGRVTAGHRFLSSGPVGIVTAAAYADTLRAAHVILDPAERVARIVERAQALAAERGLLLVEDPALATENAGLTEWPEPLIGEFDAAFLEVPPEIIRLTMRTNQKYFALTAATGELAAAFVCVANLAAPDGGASIVAGNRKVLAARLADARFFWEQDKAKTLEQHAEKLSEIVFHEKLGTVADKVERVARLARWLVESGAVPSADPALAERAARLAKADLTAATVGEFPELQGTIGRYLALAQGEDPQVADAIRDHYKPVGPNDTVPAAPVSVAVALADKLDMLLGFFAVNERPSGSRDPFALRRATIGLLSLIITNNLRISFSTLTDWVGFYFPLLSNDESIDELVEQLMLRDPNFGVSWEGETVVYRYGNDELLRISNPRSDDVDVVWQGYGDLIDFIIERLKVQQRTAGVRSDIIDAAFKMTELSGGENEDDMVRLLARVRALQAVLQGPDGANLLAGLKRAANILRIEDAKDGPHGGAPKPELLIEPAEIDLAAALAARVAAVREHIEAERFEPAMAELAALRPAIDAFFDTVTVNADDLALRRNRLALLATLRDAAALIADFTRVEN